MTEQLETQVNIEQMLEQLYIMQAKIEKQIKEVENLGANIHKQLEIVSNASKGRTIKRDVEIYKKFKFHKMTYNEILNQTENGQKLYPKLKTKGSVQSAVKRVKKELKDLKRLFYLQPFSFDIHAVLEEVLRTSNNGKIERNVAIYKQKCVENKTYQSIIDHYEEINSIPSIKYVLTQVRKEICQVLVPLYKEHRYLQLRTKFPNVIVGEAEDQPDFHYYHKKYTGFVERDFVMYFDKEITIRHLALRPEIKAGRHFNARIILHIWNLFNHKSYTVELQGYLGTKKNDNMSKQKFQLSDYDQ